MDATRHLVVMADDYGIGPETSRGIRELAGSGLVTSTVLLVNSPHAAEAVAAWHRAGLPPVLGWHPCLTLDPPLAPAERVPSLVGPDGCLWPLRAFLVRLLSGRIRAAEVGIEFRAQYRRFLDLVGGPPVAVNSHQHVAVFPPIGSVLHEVLASCRPLPYVRRVREPWPLLARVHGALVKRATLNALGRWEAQRLDRAGFPGHDWLIGITDPPWVRDPLYFSRWLLTVPGRDVELSCHPGYRDDTLIGRDCGSDDGLLQRRVDELAGMRAPAFAEACRRAGFALVSPCGLAARRRGVRHAA